MTLFRQLHHQRFNTLSYLVADPLSREAAVIDAVEGQEEAFLALLRQLGLRLRYLLETHLHDDHLSAAPRLRKLTGARIAIHESARVACCDQLLRDGDCLYVGEEALEVLHTPGHTPCSVTISFRDRLFTGDTLGIGWVGPMAAPGADPGGLYSSVHGRLYSLPDEMLVYPGHDFRSLRVSSIGQEKTTNADLPLARSRTGFLAAHARNSRTVQSRIAENNQRCTYELH
jgi:glyoxylase-like metal-dependent hydrolase (beta-lactamase superfamily II)